MHQLKKYGAIGGAIALALCWPLAVGQIGKNVIEDGIAHLTSESVKAEIVSYERGYLSSDVTTRYIVQDPILAKELELDGFPTEFVVNSHVTHGLLSLQAKSIFEDSDHFPLTLTTVTQLNGNTDYSLVLDNWHQSSQGDNAAMISVTSSTLKGHLTVLGEMSYNLNIPSVEIDFNSGEKMLISGVKGSGDGRKQDNFWLGDQEISISGVKLSDAQQSSLFVMEEANYKFSSSLDDVSSRVDSQHAVNISKLEMPEGKAENLGLDMEFGGLDSNSFNYLISLYQNSPALTPEDVQNAMPYIDTLFDKGFYLALNKMTLTLGDGVEFNSVGEVKVPEGTRDITKNPANLLPALTGDIDTFFSKGLVEQYPFIKQGIDEALIQEFIEQNDQGYQLKAQIKDGNIVFESGQKIPLMALFFSAVTQP
ncbi:hypothetical protein GCM10007938_20520 [Vibrio zhanjiangensis]|uniref:DUF945 domain-containing protein n=1 Tax=Vibrio zhanjiangensis TaxID=1046128 RepID=A0ABQ6EZS3_9VIBR|nr:DUF945 family protein [Vibrio zhanjiangensis]GLT18274.1 hypothetical protein GCM10007938_20520 [Vibrio zhanjiangensis]